MGAKDRLAQWLGNERLNSDMRSELMEFKKNSAWVEDAFGQDINFGTAGMRGLLEPGTNRINLYTVGRVTEGLAKLIEENGSTAIKRGVVIAYDSRYYSREFATHAAQILGNHGITVYLFDNLRPTPELSLSLIHI